MITGGRDSIGITTGLEMENEMYWQREDSREVPTLQLQRAEPNYLRVVGLDKNIGLVRIIGVYENHEQLNRNLEKHIKQCVGTVAVFDSEFRDVTPIIRRGKV
jgi:hypothetical protein